MSGAGNKLTFFMCPGHDLGGPMYEEQRNLDPYSDDSCRHDRRFENRGILTCQDCGMVYNEHSLSWEQNRDRE